MTVLYENNVKLSVKDGNNVSEKKELIGGKTIVRINICTRSQKFVSHTPSWNLAMKKHSCCACERIAPECQYKRSDILMGCWKKVKKKNREKTKDMYSTA